MGNRQPAQGRGSVSELTYEGWPAARVVSGCASLVILPRLGAKIASLRLSDDERDLLWQDDTRPYRAIEYAGQFGDYDASGFDECFPTIGECAYPEAPWDGVVVPDHGELWTRPWEVAADGGWVTCRATGVRLPYRFERRVEPGARDGAFALRYRVENLSGHTLRYLWSAHPLFAASEGMQVLFPGAPKGRVVFAGGARIVGETGTEFAWPCVPAPAGATVDYSRIGPSDWQANDKVVVDTPPEGWCTLYEPGTGRYCGFRLDPSQVPFVAVCVNHGWWPFTGRQGYWVALEPCTGYPDALTDVIARGLEVVLPAWGAREWGLELRVGRAGTAADAARQMAA